MAGRVVAVQAQGHAGTLKPLPANPVWSRLPEGVPMRLAFVLTCAAMVLVALYLFRDTACVNCPLPTMPGGDWWARR